MRDGGVDYRSALPPCSRVVSAAAATSPAAGPPLPPRPVGLLHTRRPAAPASPEPREKSEREKRERRGERKRRLTRGAHLEDDLYPMTN
uniref:Uncharacterized protein n=1 Tax=Oryza glumipatula TaxID=40148 RepID=A0A0E0BL07_9ORYZ